MPLRGNGKIKMPARTPGGRYKDQTAARKKAASLRHLRADGCTARSGCATNTDRGAPVFVIMECSGA